MKDGGARATSSAEVHSFLNEGEMLRALRDSVVSCDADIITGYNIVGFDIPYRIKRAE
jgi:DNA polymerase elongation subunit (family B)